MNISIISIIMPVYNAKSYISRMVDSILVQTLTNWELIMIDDGSTDGSDVLVDNYAAKDSRIKVIHKEPFEDQKVCQHSANYATLILPVGKARAKLPPKPEHHH